MKVAIPQWQGRVSPVFDVAATALVVELDGRIELARQTLQFDADGAGRRVARLVDAGVEVLICGAISRQLELLVRAAGIEVVPHTCGNVGHVLSAFLDGRLNRGACLMPGCYRRRGGAGKRGRRPW